MPPSSVKILALAGGICAVSPGMAQVPFYEEITGSHLSARFGGVCMDANAGDADGDGDPDLALAMEFQTNVLLLNDGAGNFTDASDRLPRTTHDSEDVAFADFDNDGDADLAFVSEDDRTDELYINDGTGTFADASARLVTDDVSNALVVMDLDGDGIPDLLTGNIGTDRVLISDGTGGFRDETAVRWPQDGTSRTQDLEAADVDNDGDLDILVANEGQNQLFINNNGILVDATTSNLPARNDETREIRAVDVDGDDDLDLLVANVSFTMTESARDYLLLNDGTGVFTTAEADVFPEDARSNFTVQAVDVDRDGDMDVLAPSTVFPDSTVEFFVIFATDAGETAIATASMLDIKDVDDDGDIDAVANDGIRDFTFLFDGDRLVSAPGQEAWENTKPLNKIDFETDGKPELSVAAMSMDQVLNSTGNAAPGQTHSAQLQVIDLGLDGTIDIIAPINDVLNTVGNYLILLNDGSGRFTTAAPGTVLPAEADGNGFDIEVADFDADGITDLFLCNRASVAEAPLVSGGLQRLLRGVPDPD